MHSPSKFLLLVIIIILAAAGCSGSDSNEAGASDDSLKSTLNETSDETITAGKRSYLIYCIACHGPEARGVAGLGLNLVESTFVRDMTQEELVAFVIKGRPVAAPENTTGVAMPPRGGFPNLSDEQIGQIVAFVKSINAPGGDS